MNIFRIVLWAVTFILVHIYHWSGIWHPAVWCICTSELGEAAASIVWLSAVIQTSNHACKFFGCLTFWYMMQNINSLLYVFEHLVCDVNIDSSYADMTFAQRCLRIYCALYVTLCCSLSGLHCVRSTVPSSAGTSCVLGLPGPEGEGSVILWNAMQSYSRRLKNPHFVCCQMQYAGRRNVFLPYHFSLQLTIWKMWNVEETCRFPRCLLFGWTQYMG